jgi:hypothetical protein
VTSASAPARAGRVAACVLAACALVALAASAAAFAAAPGSAPFSTAGTTEEAAARFLATLQDVVRTDDRAKLATMFRYPARVWDGKRTVVVRSRDELLARAASVFDAGLRRSILAARPDDLWANWQGVMFDSGRVWFGAAGNDPLRIITINAPTPAPDAPH